MAECIPPDELRERLADGRKVPWLVQRHIDSCPTCQTQIREYLESASDCQQVLGRSWDQTLVRWNGPLPAAEEQTTPLSRPLTSFHRLATRFGTPLHATFLALAAVATILGTNHGCN